MTRSRAWPVASWSAILLLAGACGGGATTPSVKDYQPSAVGDTWTYDLTSGGTTSTQVESVTQSGATGFTVRTTSGAGAYFLDDLVFDAKGVVSATSRVFTASGVESSSTTFSPAVLLLPADLTPGRVASSTSTVASSPATSTRTDARTLTVNGTEPVAVPAGTFQALRVTTVITTTGQPESTMVRWWAPKVGMVKTVFSPTASPSSATTWELRSYTVQ